MSPCTLHTVALAAPLVKLPSAQYLVLVAVAVRLYAEATVEAPRAQEVVEAVVAVVLLSEYAALPGAHNPCASL